MDPCHLYDKPTVDCILSDWEEWGECDVSWASQDFGLQRTYALGFLSSHETTLHLEVWCRATGQKTSNRPVRQELCIVMYCDCELCILTKALSALRDVAPCLGAQHILGPSTCMCRFPSRGGYGCTSALQEPEHLSLLRIVENRVL